MRYIGIGIAIAAFPLGFGLAIYGAAQGDAEYERARGAAFVACVQAGGTPAQGWGRNYQCTMPEVKR